MNRRLVAQFAAACVALSFAGLAATSEPRASMAEARAMLAKAVAQLKAQGRDKAFADFMNPQGAYFDRDLRVTVLSLDAKFLLNANNPRVVGKDVTSSQDADGKYYIKERMEIVKAKGKGEQRYKFLNPVTKQIENKITYFEQVGDVVVAVGAYAQ